MRASTQRPAMLATSSLPSVCLGRPSTRPAHGSLSAKRLIAVVGLGCPSFGGQRTVGRRCRSCVQCTRWQRWLQASVPRLSQNQYAHGSSTHSTGSGKYLGVLVSHSSCSSALRRTAAPGLQVGSGASYRSRRAALGGVAAIKPATIRRAVGSHPSPNPSIEGTSTSKLRLLAAAPHVKRWAS
jgi:hypothetical protein